jgi:hypothetical protein
MIYLREFWVRWTDEIVEEGVTYRGRDTDLLEIWELSESKKFRKIDDIHIDKFQSLFDGEITTKVIGCLKEREFVKVYIDTLRIYPEKRVWITLTKPKDVI